MFMNDKYKYVYVGLQQGFSTCGLLTRFDHTLVKIKEEI